jgi:endonuclease/exonuclease/phosphatase (EEP) superfamily protein YafD
VLLFAGRWIWIVPVVFLAPVVALSRRALLVPLAVAAPIVLFGVMGLHTGWRRLLPADPTGAHLRVVTVNIAGRSDVSDQMPWLLEEWRPHVVAIQECGKALPRQLGLLARWHTHASAGLCLLSRYPIASAETMDRTSLARARKESDETIGGAGYVTRYVLSTPSGPIGFTNLHLETARKGLEGLLQDRSFDRLRDNTALREIESRRAREWVRAGPMPMIVAGDFNAPPESRNLRDHWSDFTDAFAYAGRGFGYTKRNGWIRHRIDQVRYSPGARAIAARVGRDVGSDHRPVIVDFRLTGWRGARDAATR